MLEVESSRWVEWNVLISMLWADFSQKGDMIWQIVKENSSRDSGVLGV